MDIAADTFPRLLLAHAKQQPDAPAVREKDLGIWQTLQFAGYALEIWLALRFLGTDATFAQALAIEALIQLLSSIAFLMPGGLGVQEGGFVLIGGLLGFDEPTCLALAGARRVRDLLFYLPGLLAWQHAVGAARPPGSVAVTAMRGSTW